MTESNPTDIVIEKSLLAAWRLYAQTPWNRFNTWSTTIFGVAVATYAGFSNSTSSDFASQVYGLAGAGLSFYGTILGFLVAGFTIFTGIIKPRLWLLLSRAIETDSGLTYLKFIAAVFFGTFGTYVFFAALSVIILVTGTPTGPVAAVLRLLPDPVEPCVGAALSRVAFAAVATYFLYLVLSLKSFIFNIYVVTMVVVQSLIDQEERALKLPGQVADPQEKS